MTYKRKYQEVAEQLIARISAGGYAPGDKFPTERQISDEMGISRSLVREAFIMLEIEGYLDVRKGSGSYVRVPERAQDRGLLTDVGPFELLQARQLLESNIAAFAATMISKADILRLRDTLALERACIETGREEYVYDRQFHRQITEATQNSVFVDLVENLWMQREDSPMWDRLHRRIFDLSYRVAWLDDHERILESLRHRNSDGARHAMWQHLENVRRTLLELSDVGDPEFDGYLYQTAAPMLG